jgi:hypothetical protein
MPDYIPEDDDIVSDKTPAPVPILQTPNDDIKCEVPGCKTPVPIHLRFMNHYVCWNHWAADWETISLKKIFNIKETSELTIEYMKKLGLE